MTLKDWLKMNPSHKVTLCAAAGDRVRATFHGGDGIDQRFVGEGHDEALAIQSGLESRQLISGRLRHTEPAP